MQNEDARFLEAWRLLDNSHTHEENEANFEEVMQWGFSIEKKEALLHKYVSGWIEIKEFEMRSARAKTSHATKRLKLT